MNWKDAYERQMETWESIRTPFGQRALAHWAKAECQSQPSKLATYKKLIPYEEHKLLLADPVFIASDMVELIEHARQSWVNEPFLETDVLIPHAFLYLERPIYLHDRHGKTVNVRAVSYAPIKADRLDADGDEVHEDQYGFAITLYSTFDDDLDEGIVEIRKFSEDRGMPVPHLTMLHMSPVWFNVDPDMELYDVDLPNERTAAEEWWSFIQVTFRLMTQTIATRTQHSLDRHSRRRGARRGFEPREVTVIKLRRPRNAPTESEHQVEWTHRWVVESFWRNQWYPSLGLHRQIWIAPYVKGPADLPLIVKRRAYEWTR